jgi:predicted permease
MRWLTLRLNPGFAVAAVLLLALGIGGATVIFSVTDAILLRRLQALRPAELARVVEIIPGRPPAAYLDWDEFEEFQARSRSFAAVFAHAVRGLELDEGSAARQIRAGFVTPGAFDVLGVHAALGHIPARGDEVLLSYLFWQTRFHGEPGAVGRTLKLNRQVFTIAGVLPRGFNGITIESGPSIHLLRTAAPILFPGRDRSECCQWEVAGRLRPGISPVVAESETAAAMHAALIAAYARTQTVSDESRRVIENQQFRLLSLERGVSMLRDRFGSGLGVLFGGALLLLLLACANIAGMMVARAASREREMGVRAALGATRGRLIRHWLAESSLLAILGGAAGLALAASALPVIANRMPPLRDLATTLIPIHPDIRLDWRAFGFAFLLCAIAALLAGIAPAWHAARASLVDSLKSTASDPRRARLRAILTVAQVAICTVVLSNAALLLATLHALRSAPPGFDRDHVVTFTVETSHPGDLAVRAEREARAVPGVQSAALAARSLMRGSGWKAAVGLPGTRTRRDLNSSTNAVSPEYFDTMGIRILQGRSFQPGDGAKSLKPRPAIVNQAFVQRFFPDTNPVGRRFGIGMDRLITPDLEIVGVASDARYRSLREPFQPISYTCFCDASALEASGFQLEVRTVAKPETVISSVESLIRRLDPSVRLQEVRTMAQDVDDSLWAERTLAAIGSAFAIIAILVASVGLYGLISYTLAQRRREVGIRMALGAAGRHIARATLLRVAALAAVGAAAGTATALWTGARLSSILWEIAPAELHVHIAAWTVILIIALAAAAVPTWRASRIDPARALRDGG